MPFSEIMALRKAGKIEEARKLAKSALLNKPNDVWIIRAMGWVVYDDISKAAESIEQTDAFLKGLSELKALPLKSSDKLIFNKVAFKIVKMANLLFAGKQFNTLSELFHLFKDFPFTRPSIEFSSIIRIFLKGVEDWDEFLDFMDWVGWTGFLDEDYQIKLFNGFKNPPLVEKVHNAYAQKLLKGYAADDPTMPHQFFTTRIQAFLPQLTALHNQHPEYVHIPLYIGKLLLISGSHEDALKAYLPFARKKRKEFWVWTFIGDTCMNQPDLKFACYCKALSLNTQEKFLVKTRVKMAAMCLDRQLYQEARTELDRAIQTRKSEGWSIDNNLLALTSQNWYSSASILENNRHLYLKHLAEAEKLLMKDIPEEVVAVTAVHTKKNIVHCLDNNLTSIFFKNHGTLQNVQRGDVLQVMLLRSGKNGYADCISARKAETPHQCKTIKNFQGTLKVVRKGYGFATNVFVPEYLIDKYGLEHKKEISGKAIRSFDRIKSTWGWTAFSIASTKIIAGGL